MATGKDLSEHAKGLLELDLDEAARALKTDLEQGLSAEESERRLKQWGPNEIPEQKDNPLWRFLGKFWGLSAWMLELVIILSWILEKRLDAIVVMGLLIINAIISFAEEAKASKAVAELRSKLKVQSRVLRSGEWLLVPAANLVPGDIVRLRLGDFVPADIKLTSGELSVDQSGLTGESLEVERKRGDLVYSGSIVRRGEATGLVLLTGVNTFYGKTTELVQVARPKLHIEGLISNVTRSLFIVVLILSLLGLGATMYRQMPVLDVLPLLLVVLLSAVPVALPIMLTVTTSLGAIDLARENVLVTKLTVPEDAATMDVLCVDKTGTITKNKLSVAGLIPTEPWKEAELLELAALASNEADRDAIDMAFINEAKGRGLPLAQSNVLEFKPFDPSTRRTEALIEREGRRLRVTKGAAATVFQLCNLPAEEKALWEEKMAGLSANGHRTLAVAVAEDGADFRLVGLAALYDPPREDSPRLISELKNLGVKVKMLTGDSLPVATEVAALVGLGSKIVSSVELRRLVKEDLEKAKALLEEADGFAEVYPEDKYNIVKGLQAAGHVVGMTGDGVNDAPALKQAEVGIAVSSATDVAKGAAGVVLTSEGLTGIVSMVKIGRMIYHRINTWIVNKISRTILKSSYVVLTFLFLGKYTVSALTMLLLLFMTDFVKVALATDNVQWSPTPNTYDISPVVRLGVTLGIIMAVEAMGFLYYALRHLALAGDIFSLSTFSFLLLLFFALFSLFVVRERGHFWSSRPSRFLLTAIVGDAIIAVIIASAGIPGLARLDWNITLAVILYSFFFSLLVNDQIKSFIL